MGKDIEKHGGAANICSATASHSDHHQGLEPTMGFFSGTFLIVGAIIGAGVYATPSYVLSSVGSIGAAFTLWVIGGVASICGGLSYLEWGQMFPGVNGGDQYFLDKGFPNPKNLMPFLFAWASVFLIRPGYSAAISTVSAKYLMFNLFGSKEETENLTVVASWDIINKILGVVVLTSITVINAVSTKATVRMQDILSAIKLMVLVVFVLSGLLVWCGAIKGVSTSGNFSRPLFENTSTTASNYATSLFKIFYVYDGFNTLTYCAADLKNPVRNLPRCTIAGVGICTFLIVLVNLVFFAVLPYEDIVKAQEVLGGIYATKVFGKTFGTKIMPFCISLSAYGACSATVFGAARVTLAAASNGVIPKSLGHYLSQINPNFKTPVNALLLNYALAVLMITCPPGSSAFNFLVDLATYPTWVFYGLSLLGLLLYRRINPTITRPYRVWTVAPLIVILVSAFLAITPFTDKKSWLSSLVAVAGILAGVPVYYRSRNGMIQHSQNAL